MLDLGADPRCKLTGKERDVESQYDYFGARYCDARVGRWLSCDPLAEKAPSASPYSYSFGNVTALVDPNGKWPYWFHDRLIHSAFGGSSSTNHLYLLQEARLFADREEFQTPELSYTHAMRGIVNGVEQSTGDAERQFFDFLQAQRQKGRDAIKKGDPDQAVFEMGIALHAIMDATCPPHEGFQLWDGDKGKYLVEHLPREVFMSDERAAWAVSLMRKFKTWFYSDMDGRFVETIVPLTIHVSKDQVQSTVSYWKKKGYVVLVDGAEQPEYDGVR